MSFKSNEYFMWQTVIKMFFNINELPEFVFNEIQKINSSFNKCKRDCVDGICILELKNWNDKRCLKFKAKKEIAGSVMKSLSDALKPDRTPKELREHLIGGIKNMTSLLCTMIRDKTDDSKKIDKILQRMSRSKRENLAEFRKESSDPVWFEDTSKLDFLNMNSKVPFSTHCRHIYCKWKQIWTIFTNDKMPIEFCEEMAKVGIQINSVDGDICKNSVCDKNNNICDSD